MINDKYIGENNYKNNNKNSKENDYNSHHNNYKKNNKNVYDYLEKYKEFDNFNDPEYLKSLNSEKLQELSNKIRNFLIDSLSQTGGHLSSNLGVVELTLALHYVFNPLTDKIIYDVGHQTYVHKILTGRYKYFSTLRQKNGLSGFPDPEEHPADLFKTGHVGTAIAMAAGFCINGENKKDKEKNKNVNNTNVIVIIGDGSLTNGEMLESINFVANYKIKKMIIILNDNGMSISKTESAISKSLSKFTTRMKIRCMLNKLEKKGILPKKLNRILKRTITGIKSTFTANGLFEELGIPYVGPVNGHNIDELIEYLEFVKNYPETLLLHVVTQKGYGFSKAENNPEDFHSAKPFSIITGDFVKKSEKSFTNFFEQAITILGEKYKEIFTLTAAMRVGCGLKKFQEKFPERFIDTGIAESLAVTLSGSLTKSSKKAVCCIYSTFIQRAMDQIYHDIILNKIPVLFCIDRHGLVGPDGPTHHGIYIQNFLQTLPDSIVVNPAFEEEFLYFLEKGVLSNKTFFIQYPKDKIYSLNEIEEKFFVIDNDSFAKKLISIEKYITNENNNNKTNNNKTENNKNNNSNNNNNNKNNKDRTNFDFFYILDKHSGYKISDGKDVAIIASGPLLIRAFESKKNLLENDINPSIYSFPIINPIKEGLLESILSNYKFIITLEEVQFPAPIYTKLLDLFNSMDKKKVKAKLIKGFYLPKKLIPHAKRNEQLDMAGFSVNNIVNTVIDFIKKN